MHYFPASPPDSRLKFKLFTRGKDLAKSMDYRSQHRLFQRLFDGCDVTIGKVVHAPRVASVRFLDSLG
jgi:hypothetical protein